MTHKLKAGNRRFLGAVLKRSTLIDILKFLFLIAILTFLLYRGTKTLGYNWQWYRVPKYLFTIEDGRFSFGPLIEGLLVTFQITAWGLVLALVFGLITALFRLSHSFVARVVARGYVELIRNTPLLVQIFFLYFVLAPIFGLGRLVAAVLALSLFEGAYASEIIRAGIVSIHKGQWEAAHSLGLLYVADLAIAARVMPTQTSPTMVAWDPEPRGLRYEVVRGDVAQLALVGGAVDLGVVASLENDSPDTTTRGSATSPTQRPARSSSSFTAPPQGVLDGPGSYGRGSSGLTRVAGGGDCPL